MGLSKTGDLSVEGVGKGVVERLYRGNKIRYFCLVGFYQLQQICPAMSKSKILKFMEMFGCH